MKAPNVKMGKCCDLCVHMSWESQYAICKLFSNDENLNKIYDRIADFAMFYCCACDKFEPNTQRFGYLVDLKVKNIKKISHWEQKEQGEKNV